MNKTKIEWTDSTWNPVTGCLHDCEYCYARGQAQRFAGFSPKASDKYSLGNEVTTNGLLHTLNKQLIKTTKNGEEVKAAYPFNFEPTFHRYRLNDYINKKGRTIFVCSMADLFGDWIPDEWIKDVFKVCGEADQHRYLFLTKNTGRYDEIIENFASEDRGCEFSYNFFSDFWFGTTITREEEFDRLEFLEFDEGHKFISIEPLHGPLDFDFERKRCPKCRSDEVYQENPVTSIENNWYCDCCAKWEGKDNSELLPTIEWVIIGAETGNRKDKVIPKKEWIDNIVKQCDKASIPIFMKDSLIPIIGEKNMRREFPWESEDI